MNIPNIVMELEIRGKLSQNRVPENKLILKAWEVVRGWLEKKENSRWRLGIKTPRPLTREMAEIACWLSASFLMPRTVTVSGIVSHLI